MKTTQKLLIVLLAFSLIFALSSCARGEEDLPDGFVLAENEGGDFALAYPSEWVLERNDPGMISVYVSETDFSNVSVTAFTANSEYADLREYMEKFYFQQFRDNFANLKIAENEDGSMKFSTLKVADSDAIQVDYSALFGGEEFSFRTYVISEGGYLYSITYTAKSDRFDTHLEALKLMISNFRFR